MNSCHTPKRVCRLLAATALLAASLLPALPAATGAAFNVAATGSSVTVALTRITPTIAASEAPITITGTVLNSSAVQITAPVVRALIGVRPLTTRKAVSDWATTAVERSVTEAARTSLGSTLGPGSLAKFTLTIPAKAVSISDAFAILPLRVDVEGTTPQGISQETDLGSVQTFLPALSSVKKYEPLSIAWLIPLTLDPDPALHGLDSATRTAAWARAIGPGSRLDGLIAGTDSTQVTWDIDPAILGPPQAATAIATASPSSPTASPSSAPKQGSATDPDQVTAATTALANRLRAAAPRHTLWSLPYADPDLSALLPLTSGSNTLRSLIGRTSPLEATVGPTRAGVAWPVGGTLTSEHEEQLRLAFSSPGLAAVITSASTLTSQSRSTTDASRKTNGGLPMLAYDDALSSTFAQTDSASSGALTIQRFLADSMALLGERPGTSGRSVLVAAPRTFAGDPTVLVSFFAAIATAPWLSPTTTEALLAASGAATPEAASDTTTLSLTSSAGATDPLNPGISPVTSALLLNTASTRRAITGIASIRDDAQLFASRWTDAQNQLFSVRWRGRPAGPAAIVAATSAAITAVSRGVHVVPSSVNFFADRGVLQVTVVNDLDVPVHDVHLRMTPSQPRLRIEQQPGPLRIGANSRTNVPLQVTAIAAGLVPIRAVLTTANGTTLGQDADVDVRVQPTSTWIYWVLGGAAAIILVLGTYRSLRRGSTRASRPAEPEIMVND